MRKLSRKRSIGVVPAILIILLASCGWAGWIHNPEGDYQVSYWNSLTNPKFRYHSATGRWEHYSTIGSTWYALSATGLTATFIGNGDWYYLGAGLKFRYDVTANNGFFARGAQYRFYYQYTPGQWYTSGYGGGWHEIGGPGMSAGVLGNGAWHDLDSGLRYRYDFATDFGFYSRGSQYRFYYKYLQGQWYNSGYGGGWYVLGDSGLNASVLGDGDVHELGNSLKYRYDFATDFGFYSRGSQYRFYYKYLQGQWYNSGYGGGWYALSAANRNASVFGDGEWHDSGTGLKYRYNVTNDFGYFTHGGQYRFYYNYLQGQWHNSGYAGGWGALGAPGQNAGVMADGSAHSLGTWFGHNWWYTYDTALDRGQFGLNSGANYRFAYGYGLGTWWHHGYVGGWKQLGNSGYASAFIGTGDYLDLGTWYGDHWRFYYDLLESPGPGSAPIHDDGYFQRERQGSWLTRFTYRYSDGCWTHYGSYGAASLGYMGLSADFMGDGAGHHLGNWAGGNWWYTYRIEPGYKYMTDRAQFSRGTGANYRFEYWYGGEGFFASGTWYHYDGVASYEWKRLGNYYGGYSPAFIGGGGEFYLGTMGIGDWVIMYDNANDRSCFRLNAEANYRFAYGYNATGGLGTWWHYGYTGGWNPLGINNGSHDARFLAGIWYDLGTWNGQTWYYCWNTARFGWGEYTTNAGGMYRFAYDYSDGSWRHFNFNNGQTMGFEFTSRFIGDGNYYYCESFKTAPSLTKYGYRLTYFFRYSGTQGYLSQAESSDSELFSYDYSSGIWRYRPTSGQQWFILSPSGARCLVDYVGRYYSDYLKWTFDAAVNPANSNFDPNNRLFYFYAWDDDQNGVVDRINYYDNRGHIIMNGLVQWNARGARIAIDSFWAGDQTWTWYEWCWSESEPFSPMVLVIDYSGHELFRQMSEIHVLSNDFRLQNARAWIWEDENGNGYYDFSSNTGDRIIQWYQQKGGTCGVFTAMNITASVWGNASNPRLFPDTFPDDAITWFSTNKPFTPAYNPATMDLNDGTWGWWGTTSVSDRNSYLAGVQGFESPTQRDFSWSTLQAWVNVGALVQVGMDAAYIWASSFNAVDANGVARDADFDGYLDAGYAGTPNATGRFHAVWVRGFHYDAGGNITHVILADSGTIRGAFAKVPVNHFIRAAEAQNTMGCVSAPTFETWSPLGVNTWSFNPAIFSATW